MAVTSVGWRGTVNEQEIAEILTLAGVRSSVAGGADWKPTAVAGDRRVAVAAGTGYAAFIKTDTDAAAIIDLPTPAVAQWFLIVNRRTWADKSSVFMALPGSTTAATPVQVKPPSLFPADFEDTPGVVLDQEIAWVWARASTTALVIFDVRKFPPSAVRFSKQIIGDPIAGITIPTTAVPAGTAPIIKTGFLHDFTELAFGNGYMDEVFFTEPFPNACTGLTVTQIKAGSAQIGNYAIDILSATSFRIFYPGAGTTAIEHAVMWTAVGH